MGRELLQLWSALIEDAGPVRCVVLTGSGGAVDFLQPVAIRRSATPRQRQWQLQHELFERMYWTLTDLPLPVVAAVNGAAYGGGMRTGAVLRLYLCDRGGACAARGDAGHHAGAGGTQVLRAAPWARGGPRNGC